MANIVVTTTGDIFNIDFGVYDAAVKMKKSTFIKTKVRFELMVSDAFVRVSVQDMQDFAVSFDGSAGTLQIDLINGVAPTSNSDLYDKLALLL